MGLLAPLLLLGMLAVAVPLLVHLVQREKREPTAFPSLMFLEKTPAPFTARRHLRDPWLLALRVLAILALALAFARPVFGRRPQVGGVDQRRREIVLLLDRSFSMRIGGRWARGRASVDSVIRSLGRGDRMTLVTFDRRAQGVTEATGNAVSLKAALDSVTLSDESTRFTPALAVAQQRFAASDAPRKALVVVSDFQRSGFDLTEDARPPLGTEITTVDVSGGAAVSDRSVRSVEVREDRRSGTPEVLVSARIANAGAAVRGIEARLEVGGRVVERRSVDLPADGGASVTFAAVPMPPTPVAARVVLDADAVPGDDAYHFLLQQAPALRVLLVSSSAAPFVARALSIGDLPRFTLVAKSPAAVRASDLVGTQIVLLADGAFPNGIGAAALRRFVENGGGLLIALGDATNPRAWTGEADALVPGSVQRVRERSGLSGAVLGGLDERHPAMAWLSGQRSGDLAARFDRYRAIDTTAGVLARFDDGAPAITQHTVGAGRVITLGSSLDGTWNDLPRQPAFLPLVQQLAEYAANWREPTRAVPIGTSVRPRDLGAAASTANGRWVATTPSGARTQIGGDDAPATLELRESGVHELRPGGQPGARPLLVAANIAPAELDFASADALRWTNALTPTTANASLTSPVSTEESAAERESRQSTWWYLLCAVALLLIAESVVARRAGSTTPATE